jgi:hypothetical protein
VFRPASLLALGLAAALTASGAQAGPVSPAFGADGEPRGNAGRHLFVDFTAAYADPVPEDPEG